MGGCWPKVGPTSAQTNRNNPFQRQGYVANTASSPDEAEVVIRNNPPDLIILDPFVPGQMPGMSGFEFCQDLKSNPLTELIPVIMISGLDYAEFKVRGIEAGADDFLNKPVFAEELIAVLKTQLKRKRAVDRRFLSMQRSAPDHESPT